MFRLGRLITFIYEADQVESNFCAATFASQNPKNPLDTSDQRTNEIDESIGRIFIEVRVGIPLPKLAT